MGSLGKFITKIQKSLKHPTLENQVESSNAETLSLAGVQTEDMGAGTIITNHGAPSSGIRKASKIKRKKKKYDQLVTKGKSEHEESSSASEPLLISQTKLHSDHRMEFKIKAEERSRKKQLRRQIRDEFYSLIEKGNKYDINSIAEFICKFDQEVDLMRDALAPYKRFESLPAVIVWQYLSHQTSEEFDKLLVRQKLLEERKAWLETRLPNPIVIIIETTEQGPRLDTVVPEKVYQFIEQMLGRAAPNFQIKSTFPFTRIGNYPIQIEFPEGVAFSSTIQLVLQQEELPADCSESLIDVPPIPLPEIGDVLECLQQYLTDASQNDISVYFPILGRILRTAYDQGYWKSPWVQNVLQEWRAKQDEYQTFILTGDVGADYSETPNVSLIDALFGLHQTLYSGTTTISDAIQGLRSSVKLVKRDLMDCQVDEKFMSSVPTKFPVLLTEAKNYDYKADEDQVGRFLQLAKAYAEKGRENLLRLSLTQYCFLKGRQQFTEKKRDARPYLQSFLLLYSRIPIATQKVFVWELYNSLSMYFDTYNIYIDVKDTEDAEIVDKFYLSLLPAISSVAKQRQFQPLGRCIIEINTAIAWWVAQLINRMTMRDDAREALKIIVKSLQEPLVFRADPLQCLHLLARIDTSEIAMSLSRQSLSNADERRLAVIALLKFVSNSNSSPSVTLKGFASQASADTKGTLAFSLLVEPFILNLPKKESELKALLMAEALGLPAGTKPTEYFIGVATDLATVFDRFAQSSDPNVKGKHGYNILDTIRTTRKFLLERLRGDQGDLVLQFYRRIEAYVTAEQAKLIHDTALEIALMSDRALHSPDNSRITIEIRNVGEGTAHGLVLEVFPVQGQYQVEGRHRIYNIDMLADKEPVQVEVWIQPVVGVNQSIDLSVELRYNTLKKKDRVAELAKDNRTVWLYPVTQFVRVPQPYNIGEPATTWFYGRQNLLESMADNLRVGSSHDTSMIVYGLKRAGKTSVVKRFIEHTLRDRELQSNYISVYTDLLTEPGFKGIKNNGDFLYTLMYVIVEALVNHGFSSFSRLNLVSYKDDFQQNSFEAFSVLLKEILGNIQPRRLLLVLDEFSTLQCYLKQADESAVLTGDLFSFLSNTIQSTNQLTFIFTGTYVLLEMMREHAFDLAKICAPRMVSFLDDASARQLVIEPVKRDEATPHKGWLEYDPRVVERIVTVTGRHPYLIHYLCIQLVDRMNHLKYNSVNLNDIGSIIEEVISKPPHAMPMLTLWNEFDLPQHKVLSAIAAKTSAVQNWVEINEIVNIFEEMGDLTPLEQILVICSSLADAALLERSSEESPSYRITIPLYQMWLKQNKPLVEVFGK